MSEFNIPVSILDLATIVQGDSNAAPAFKRSMQLAKHAEKLGFTRYWFAEHHNMESVASAATSVLIGYVASGTSSIRLGAGGVMLPNHAPLIIAEQFGTLETLYPGRIDLGLGRAPGTDPLTSHALRRNIRNDIDSFPDDVLELINYFEPQSIDTRVKAIPGKGTRVPVWLLGSSTYSAQLAAHLGLPFAFAAHFAPTYLHEAMQLYKSRFQPSAFLKKPYAMACVNIIAADTDEKANYLASSFYQLALGLFRNDRRPLPPPVNNMNEIWTEAERLGVNQMLKYAFIGSPATIQNKLKIFIQETGVQEIMMASHLYDVQDRMKALELVIPMFSRRVPADNLMNNDQKLVEPSAVN